MARDLLAVVGYETGGHEEMDPVMISLWALLRTSPAPPSAKETYVGEHNWKQRTNTIPATFVNGHWITVSFPIRFTFDSPNPLFDFMNIFDGTNAYLTLRYKESPFSKTLELYDSNGVLIFSWSGVIKDVWHNLEIKFKPQSATSDVIVYMDRSQVGSATGVDCDPGNATDSVQARFSNGEVSGHVYHVSNVIIESDDGAAITTVDTLGHERTVLGPYTWDNATAVPDFGDNLDVGTWDNVGETPGSDINTTQYDGANPAPQGGVTTNNGSKAGPKNDSDVDGSILGASWGWRARHVGSPASQTIKRKWGASNVVSTDNTTSQLDSIGTDYQTFWEVRSGTHADTPTPNEYFQIGFGIGDAFNNKDIELAEMWCFLVHQEPAPTQTILDYERKTRGVGRGVMVGVA